MDPLTVGGLAARYRAGETTPGAVLDEVARRIAARGDSDGVWIERVPLPALERRLRAIEARRARGDRLPLYGIPFAVKDNIDVAGLPTTAGCPAYAYEPAEDAVAVRRLLDAGAVLVGKCNMDQFATGLTGARSPYGIPRCVQSRSHISGGSSSGSAVAVAAGLVAFALGTDTAGSGRVPAALNGIVGLKPTRGRISTRGVVPACRTLDCVSVFAHSVDDARAVLEVAEGYDKADPFSRRPPRDTGPTADPPFRFGVPRDDQLEFFGDAESARLYRASLSILAGTGGRMTEIDFEPFLEAGEFLYGGPWVAERDAAVGDFIRTNPDAVHPALRAIVGGAAPITATETFRAIYRLETLRRRAAAAWRHVDALVLPTTGTTYRVEEVLADPFSLNTRLGHYTAFLNLLDLCAVALPAGFRENRTPFGISLVAPTFADRLVCRLGSRYEAHARGEPVGRREAGAEGCRRRVWLAVAGAHLSGQPLNHQLTARGGRLVRACRTAPSYRLYALAGASPPKPGLVHAGGAGAAIEVEVWELGLGAFGAFVAEVPPPLAIGSVELDDGGVVKGFVCEPRAVVDATEITRHGGWRAWISRKA